MPRNTYEDDSGPTTSVYEDVHLIVFALSYQWHVGSTCQHHLLPLILSHLAASAAIDGEL
jgi:hypothetical protein